MDDGPDKAMITVYNLQHNEESPKIDFCEKVKAEQTRLFRRLSVDKAKGQCIY